MVLVLGITAVLVVLAQTLRTKKVAAVVPLALALVTSNKYVKENPDFSFILNVISHNDAVQQTGIFI